jgi:putative acetyltransferase
MHTVDIQREPIESTVAQELIGALNRELDERYPEEGANHFRLDPGEVAPGRGGFFVARLGATVAGCGAVRRIDAQAAEVKRMYVPPEQRGRGVATRLLAHLEAEARRLGATRLVLETGERQFESVALYRRAGFVEIPRYGEYVDSPLSLCMGKVLAGPDGDETA